MDNEYILTANGELYHWGIKGMKWGIRRYQNKDGSLTPAGKKRKEILDGTKVRDKSLDDAPKVRDKSLDDAPDSSEVRKLAGLSTNKKTSVTIRDRNDFVWDIEGTDESHWNEKLSSKNPECVRKISEELDDYWNRAIRENDDSNFGNGQAKHYYDTYVKNNKEDYAKAVIEEVEYWRNEREKMQHADDGDVYILTTNGELYHHGILGMKWGVRRYQNKDGSLTSAGKKRRAKLEAELEKIGGKSPEKKLSEMSDEEVAAKTNRIRLENNLRDEMRRSNGTNRESQKSAEEINIDELRNKVNRLQLEKQYKQLQAELNPKKKSFIEDIGKKTLNEVLVPTAMNVGKNYLEKTIKKKLGLDTEDPVAKLEKQVRKLEAEQKIKKLTNADSGLDLDSIVEKLGSMSDADFEKLKRASTAQGFINNITGKKNKDK